MLLCAFVMLCYPSRMLAESNALISIYYLGAETGIFPDWLCQYHDCWWPGPRLNINTVFPQCGDSHVKDKTVGETVLSLTWVSLYWYDSIFIWRSPPGPFRRQQYTTFVWTPGPFLRQHYITFVCVTTCRCLFVKFISVSRVRSRKGLASSPLRLRGHIGLQAHWVGRPSPKDPKKWQES